MEKRILTGIKPTGTIHLGNYFGAIRQMVALQEEGEMFMFLADLHALTDFSEDGKRHHAETFKEVSHNAIRAYIALGINPEKVVIYRQSEFPQVTELFWIFSCLLKHQYLTIGHAYKDARQRDVQPDLGTFLYPVLMAADILLPGAEMVPVGKDQKQHLEMTREIARKFNMVTQSTYFTEPQEHIVEDTAAVPGTDGEKMSKSRKNILPIFGDEDIIRRSIMAIKTDSTPAGQPIQPGGCTVCRYLELLLPKEEYGSIANRCMNGTVQYKELKETLITAYLAYFQDARKTYQKLEQDTEFIDRVLHRHRSRVTKLLNTRLEEVRAIIGFEVPARRGFFG